jgi:hypothetical protein
MEGSGTTATAAPTGARSDEKSIRFEKSFKMFVIDKKI